MTSSNAPYEIEYKLYPNYLHARVIAEDIDRLTSQSFLSDVLLECANHRRKRLMLERGNEGGVVVEELMTMMQDLLQLRDTTKIAFLNHHIKHGAEIGKIVKMAAGLGGNYRCFVDFSDAEEWLVEDADD